MKIRLLFLFVFILSYTFSSAQQNSPEKPGEIIFQSQDKKILDKIFKLFSSEKDTPISELMIKIGSYFKETPYVAHTLESETEQLVINLKEMDCNTFAENCLAISRTIRSGELTLEHFTNELKAIRYRDGKLNGYPSRLHYFSDWIYNNQQKKLVKDVSEEIGQTRYIKKVNFMSTHPGSYQQLKDSSQLVKIIAEKEKEISARQMFYIPETKIAEVDGKLINGDIVGITTNIEGLDISHVVILIRNSGHVYMLHASSMAGKVVVSEETLKEYLLNSKSATGIMVARPL